jgi:hypothetical protein
MPLTAEIRVTNDIISKMEIGIGWNEATVLEGRWPDHSFTGKDWDRYFGLMEWSGCHWLRHAVTITDWEPENDNQDPEKTDWNRFRFESEQMQRHYEFFDQAEKRNIKVLVTNWRLGARWLTSQEEKWILAHPDDEEEFAESLAALIYHLKKVKNYENIWALSLWNEPNGNWAYTGPKANYPDTFWPLYEKVDHQLKRLGVRGDIWLLGPDTSTGGRPDHIPEMLSNYGPILDIIADHDYSAFRGERMGQSVSAYGRLIHEMEKTTHNRLPFVIGEFGNYGAGSKAVDDDEKVYDGALSTTAYLFRMLNQGVAGLARWEFHIYGDTWRNFGALTRTDPEFVFRPYGPVYYPHAITARYVKPGWEVRELKFRERPDGLDATALTSNDDITILLLNDNDSPVQLDLNLDLAFLPSMLHHLQVTGPMPKGILRKPDEVPDKAGKISVSLPPRSITALTSLDPGDLNLPMKLSLKKEEVQHR